MPTSRSRNDAPRARRHASDAEASAPDLGPSAPDGFTWDGAETTPEARPRRERWASGALALACLVLLAVQAGPRLVPRAHGVRWEDPGVSVAVVGAVGAPGTYALPFGTTVGEAIDRAGGFDPNADRSLVDPAAVVTAGSTIRVLRVTTDRGAERTDLNHAAPADLEALPGIGPALAARIVAARPFARVDDLVQVSGIGPATLARLRPLVTLE